MGESSIKIFFIVVFHTFSSFPGEFSAEIPHLGMGWDLRHHTGAPAAEILAAPGWDLLWVDAGGADGADAGSGGEGPWDHGG